MHHRALRLSRLLLVCATLGAALTLPEQRAEAQTASEIAMARQWFADGLAREEKGEYVAALELFRRAVQVKKTPQIVYHVGFCESRTGALVEALVDLDSAATLARAAHMDNVVAASQSELADVNARLPSLEVHVQGSEPPSRLVVDGSTIALSMLHTKMPLDPGEHTITVELASGATATKRVTLAERDARTVELAPVLTAASVGTPPPVAPIVAPPATSPAPPTDVPATAHSNVAGWALTGVGGAATIGGIVLVLAAHGKVGALSDSCPSHTGCNPTYQDSYNSAKTLDTVGLVVGAVGIAAAGVGISMLVFHPSSSTQTAFRVTPRGFDLTTRF